MNARVRALVAGGVMDVSDSELMFGAMLRGELDDIDIAAALVALRDRGESPAELAGAARALLAAALPFPRPPGLLADTCGTGGDGQGSINISTAVAFVSAACGVPVAKHGNRSVSSRCGSADVLEALGARLNIDGAAARRMLDACGVAFLFAPGLHPGIARVMPVRRALGTRTIFNALGPLVNPARPDVQLVGVYDPALCGPVAETLHLLGARAALVVHGDGLDELALHSHSVAARLVDGRVEHLRLAPADFGLAAAPREALRGGDVAHNAAALRAVLAGTAPEAHHAAVVMNTGALLWVAGRVGGPLAGAQVADTAIRSGVAAAVLDRFLGAHSDA